MRNLTIKREKNFVGCLISSKVYIEDYESSDLTINKIPCRKLGEVKNGEEKTFEIGNNEAKVFVISDKLSKDYSNEFYQLSAGENDVALIGKCEYNPAGGNAFRFYNNDTEETVKNRKKGNKVGIIILVCALVVGFILGFVSVFIESCAPMDISYSNMTMTVTAEFEKDSDSYGFDCCYYSYDISIFIDKHSFADMPNLKNLSLREYGNAIIDEYDLGGSLKTENGLTYYEYTNTNDGDVYMFRGYIYESYDAFWSIEFGALKEDFIDREDEIKEWAASVAFAN